MSEESEGLPLDEALRAYSDPDLWAAYEEAARAAAGKRSARYFVVGGKPVVGWDVAARVDRDNALVAARDRAWHAVVQAFRSGLVSGELLATGCEAPATLDPLRRSIPASRWTKLRIDFRRSSARWLEVELREILVRPAAAPAHERGAAGAQQEDDAGKRRSSRARPGRRTFLPEAEEEMRALASIGRLTDNFKVDSHILALRVAARHGGQEVCRPKTIRNGLNKLYRILCEEQRARNNSGDFQFGHK